MAFLLGKTLQIADMNSFFYIYNNEAIVSLVIAQVLKQTRVIEISRIAIVVSVLLNDQLVDVLNEERNVSLKCFFKQTAKYQMEYNRYYYGLLPIVINSLKIIVDSNIGSYKDGIIYSNEKNSIINSDISKLNDRFNKINHIIPLFLSLIDKYSTEKLYELLRIRL